MRMRTSYITNDIKINRNKFDIFMFARMYRTKSIISDKSINYIVLLKFHRLYYRLYYYAKLHVVKIIYKNIYHTRNVNANIPYKYILQHII